MNGENNFYSETAEESGMEYLEYQGNRFLIDRGILKDVQVESATVRIPEMVKEIRRQAFLDARLLGRMTVLIVPASVKKIERLAFAGMVHLKLVELQASIATLEQGVFRNCMELEYISLPNTLRNIESRAFENCLNLKKVELPRAWVQIAEDAFLNCVNLKDSRIRKGIEEAEYRRKKEEMEARKARFPHLFTEEKVKQKEPEAQQTEDEQQEAAEAQQEWQLPQKPAEVVSSEIKSAAEELLEAELAKEQLAAKALERPPAEKKTEAHFCIHEGVLERCEVNNSSHIRIPEGVTALADRVFYGMEQLGEIEFPTTLSYIGAQALEGTGWLKKEREKNSYVIVNGILISAFFNSMVMEAKLPDNVYRIAPYAFYRSEAQLVVLPESVGEVDARAFVESDVTEIDFSPRADVVLHTPLAVRCSKLKELYFQGQIDRLEDNFVEDCPALKRVCLKWKQTVVNKQAFPENVRIWVI